MNKRITLSIIIGAILGIFCIIGVGYRFGYFGNELFLFANWYNRVIMGIIIGLAGSITIVNGKYNFLIRGLLLGLIVSFSLYLSTEFRDLTGFIAGIVYGVIIDWVATRYSK